MAIKPFPIANLSAPNPKQYRINVTALADGPRQARPTGSGAQHRSHGTAIHQSVHRPPGLLGLKPRIPGTPFIYPQREGDGPSLAEEVEYYVKGVYRYKYLS
ncbi:hypothetical protein NCU02350 [Neurospora crassa OR74A]|uniref:Uncharacterized protein n=1 Tax=Neurospora crassa (strain ATCC 24698 / 74-OR23-1A / CBS 708.71 / DSM 1257 / FGSC 987) TaxID=367110 RepID=Q7S4X5_NEUCR|nr:hypothetical protein NCU02350 [Neurospora crassa OR74A]EAA30535.1 hypothetical protein NCU02350 [Neurospora crassa OR74A]|eukprot:XP_959771.1 hypothetical protein NCU02350 [Neurospora crassa OR74A]